MARPGIAGAEVFAACDQIFKTGVSPTIERVRLVLGTGSNSTISSYINDWKDKKSGIDKKSKDYRDGYRAAVKDMNRAISKLYKGK